MAAMVCLAVLTRTLQRGEKTQEQAVRHDRADGNDDAVDQARRNEPLAGLERAPAGRRGRGRISARRDLEHARVPDLAALEEGGAHHAGRKAGDGYAAAGDL